MKQLLQMTKKKKERKKNPAKSKTLHKIELKILKNSGIVEDKFTILG